MFLTKASALRGEGECEEGAQRYIDRNEALGATPMLPPPAPELFVFTEAALKEGFCAGSHEAKNISKTAVRRSMVLVVRTGDAEKGYRKIKGSVPFSCGLRI